ncbi:protein NLRC3-like isoform X2 [Dysidea avara]
MFIIIPRAHVNDNFAKFCQVLSSEECYVKFVDSLLLMLAINQCRDHIIKLADVKPFVKNHVKNSCTLESLMNKLDHATPKFQHTFYLYLKGTPSSNHGKLVHIIEESISKRKQAAKCFRICTLPDSQLKDYQCYLKKQYMNNSIVSTDSFCPPHDNYIDLNLVVCRGTVEDEATCVKHSFLHCETETLGSLSDIFQSNIGRQVVLIQGHPGSGKTTLANKICRDWAEGSFIPDYSNVVLITLKDSRIAEAKCMRDIIALSMERKASEIASKMEEIEGKGFVLILEGWDELEESRKYHSLFTDIIMGKVLPQAVVLVTTRPSAAGSINKKLISQRIEILGFTTSQITEYLTHSFTIPDNTDSKSTDELIQLFQKQLNSVPFLKDLAQIPINLSILVNLFKENQLSLPNTLTELYKQFILLRANHHYQRLTSDRRIWDDTNVPDQILSTGDKLGKIAFDFLLNHKLTFTEGDINSYCFDSNSVVPWSFDGLGLFHINSYTSNFGVVRTYQFLHKTMQDLLAAHYLSKLEPKRQVKILKMTYGSTAFELLWVFYAGMTEFKLVNFTECLPVPGRTLLPMLSISKKKTATSPTSRPHSSVTNAHINNTVYKEFMITLALCCIEAKNSFLCHCLGNSASLNDICYFAIPESANSFVAQDKIVSAVSYVIENCKKLWIVKSPSMKSGTIISSFNYHFSPGNLYGLEVCISPNQIKELKRFMKLQRFLCHLDLSQSVLFDDDCAVILADIIKHNDSLHVLFLNHCKITTTGITALAEALVSNCTLKWLSIKENPLTIEDIINLVQVLKYNSAVETVSLDKQFSQPSTIKALLHKVNIYRKTKRITLLTLKH